MDGLRKNHVYLINFKWRIYQTSFYKIHYFVVISKYKYYSKLRVVKQPSRVQQNELRLSVRTLSLYAKDDDDKWKDSENRYNSRQIKEFSMRNFNSLLRKINILSATSWGCKSYRLSRQNLEVLSVDMWKRKYKLQIKPRFIYCNLCLVRGKLRKKF